MKPWLLLLCLALSGDILAQTLPQPVRPVVDLVGTVDPVSRRTLTGQITRLETETNWRVRVLVQQNETPGKQIKTYWGLNERSVLVVLDLKQTNPLFFNVGTQVRAKLPRTFWQELQSRYGNQYYIGENGRGKALVSAVGAIDQSLRQGGRATVPGLSGDHWLLTFASSVLGGLVVGFACHPRRPGEVWHWPGLMFSAPLWSILFLIFGLGVVLVRTADWVPVLQNSAGFLVAAGIAFLVPTPQRAEPDSR
ncbi:TPM domain-containing protein [Candidatus Cyanaurora vandensis]|uniref:TPM domain-containing protein n=1 Tax=Candidatus Cyanaurora vandensis TaxID=2714958 RepID=UPI00257A85D2|nr:TPM domain-containing protein [Candidatus Cyanaurora vandensis]